VFSPPPVPCKVIVPLLVRVGCEIKVGVHVCPNGEFVTFSEVETRLEYPLGIVTLIEPICDEPVLVIVTVYCTVWLTPALSVAMVAVHVKLCGAETQD
jgi:hypothetical protein